MSTTKLEAARELIREKHYSEARAILKTIDHPTARKWLAKLDEIDPPGRSSRLESEQERYFARENRRANRRRIGTGIEMIFMGIIVLALFGWFAMPTPSINRPGVTVVNIGLGWALIPLALILIVGGLLRLRKRD